MLTFAQLTPGSFYIPVFERIEPQGAEFYERFRTDSPHYQYLGGGVFVDEDGEPVDSFYDPELGVDVGVEGADGFIQ